MDPEVVGEDVAHHHHVVLDVVHSEAVHAEVLGQQGLACNYTKDMLKIFFLRMGKREGNTIASGAKFGNRRKVEFHISGMVFNLLRY